MRRSPLFRRRSESVSVGFLKFVDLHGETGFIKAPIRKGFRLRPTKPYVDRENGRWSVDSRISLLRTTVLERRKVMLSV